MKKNGSGDFVRAVRSMGFTTWISAAAVVFPVPASSTYGGLLYELAMAAAIATDSIKKILRSYRGS